MVIRVGILYMCIHIHLYICPYIHNFVVPFCFWNLYLYYLCDTPCLTTETWEELYCTNGFNSTTKRTYLGLGWTSGWGSVALFLYSYKGSCGKRHNKSSFKSMGAIHFQRVLCLFSDDACFLYKFCVLCTLYTFSLLSSLISFRRS